MLQITHILIEQLVERLKEKNIRIKIDDAVVEYVTKKGTNVKMGARPLRRSLQENIEDPMADALLKRNMMSDVSISCTLKKDVVSFSIRPLKPKHAPDILQISNEYVNAF